MFLKVDSFYIESYKVPSFKVSQGDLLILHSPIYDIDEVLFQRNKIEVQITKSPKFVNFRFETNSFNIRSFFKKKTVFNYLKTYSKLPDNNINLLLNYLKLDRNTLLKHVGGGTNKLLINIEIAFNQSKFITLSTAGLDPKGVDLVYKWLLKKTKPYSAIIFNYPSSLKTISSFKLELLNEKPSLL